MGVRHTKQPYAQTPAVINTTTSLCCCRNTGGAGAPGMEAKSQGRDGELSAHFQGL